MYLTTAVNRRADDAFRTGLYGDVAPVDDLSEHTWKVRALDAATGAVAWERDVFTGTPAVKPHPKASQANSTPATDGRRVVALFGSIGLLVCYDTAGELVWKREIGVLDSGWFFDPNEELAKIPMHEAIVATPSISNGLIVIRTAKHVYGIGETGGSTSR